MRTTARRLLLWFWIAMPVGCALLVLALAILGPSISESSSFPAESQTLPSVLSPEIPMDTLHRGGSSLIDADAARTFSHCVAVTEDSSLCHRLAIVLPKVVVTTATPSGPINQDDGVSDPELPKGSPTLQSRETREALVALPTEVITAPSVIAALPRTVVPTVHHGSPSHSAHRMGRRLPDYSYGGVY